MLSCWSTCSIGIHLCTRHRLMTSPGCRSTRLPRMHISIDFLNENAIFLQIYVIVKLQLVFLFLEFISARRVKISCINCSFLRLSTLPEVWNFYARHGECVICFLFLFFVDFIRLGKFYVWNKASLLARINMLDIKLTVTFIIGWSFCECRTISDTDQIPEQMFS